MDERRVIIVGGGAAGFFAAVTCAETSPGTRVTLLEKGGQFLSKVRISGGGRCNVTHACFDPRALEEHYPRGGSALMGAFRQFQPTETVEWFESRGVRLKTEPDGRMFPVTDSSLTIVNCLVESARAAGAELMLNQAVTEVRRTAGKEFELIMADGRVLRCDRLMLATGGCRAAAAGGLAVALGHKLTPPVPSLFALQVATPWLRQLAGISLDRVEVAVPSVRLRQSGPMVITHQGLSGPAILRLSAWGARQLHTLNYTFPLKINWLPGFSVDQMGQQLNGRRSAQAAKLVVNSPLVGVPSRLWEQLVLASGITRETRWAALSKNEQHQLVRQLCGTELAVEGKSLNKDEFVTCGGVRLGEVDFRTMESRICPRLYIGGELLDIDGLTGGFNFQSAWTTGWIAGRAMAGRGPGA